MSSCASCANATLHKTSAPIEDRTTQLEMEETAAEIRRLKTCINDLLGVLSLPAIWRGHEPSRIAGTLLDVLLGVLRLDFAYFRLSDSSGRSSIELVRGGGRRNLAAQPQA